jgi:hypothetical protein
MAFSQPRTSRSTPVPMRRPVIDGAGNTPTHNLASFTQIPGHIDDHDAVRPLR